MPLRVGTNNYNGVTFFYSNNYKEGFLNLNLSSRAHAAFHELCACANSNTHNRRKRCRGVAWSLAIKRSPSALGALSAVYCLARPTCAVWFKLSSSSASILIRVLKSEQGRPLPLVFCRAVDAAAAGMRMNEWSGQLRRATTDDADDETARCCASELATERVVEGLGLIMQNQRGLF